MFIRILFYIMLGIGLLIANVWYGRRVHAAFFAKRHLPQNISPFQIIGKSDDAKLGSSLANMLVAKMRIIQDEMSEADSSLRRAGDTNKGSTTGQLGPESLRPDAFYVPTGVWHPLELEMKVAGVEVGGVLSWMYRWTSSEDSVQVSVYYRESEATVTCNTGPGYGKSLWISTASNNDAKMIEDLAYALTQVDFSQHHPYVGTLSETQFQLLLEKLFKAGKLNRDAAARMADEQDYRAFLPEIESVISEGSRIRNWPALQMVIGEIAERAKDSTKALLHFQAALSAVGGEKENEELRKLLEEKISTLTLRMHEASAAVASLEKPQQNQQQTIVDRLRSLTGIGQDELKIEASVSVIAPVPSYPENDNRIDVIGSKTSEASMGEYCSFLVQAAWSVLPATRFTFVWPEPTTAGPTWVSHSSLLEALTGYLRIPVEKKSRVLLIPFGPLSDSEIMGRVLKQIQDQQVLIVLPAGNSPDASIPFESTDILKRMVVVSSVSVEGRKSPFTTEGPSSFWAPGEQIPYSLPGKKPDMTKGTGFAGAIAASIAGALWAKHPNLSLEAVVTILRASSVKKAGYECSVINLQAALKNAQAESTKTKQ